MSDEILAEVSVSGGRRWLGLMTLGMLGVMLMYLGFSLGSALGWQLFLIVVGALAIWGTERMWRATSVTLELTKEVLREKGGNTIAEISDITNVERGMLAFKPSNGFVLTLANKAPKAWRPGIWWRIGRRVGVGGVVSAGQAKFMSEVIATLLYERDS